MFTRSINLPESHSFFLFGARGVGKTKLLEHHFAPLRPIIFDLLNPELLDRLDREPSILSASIKGQQPYSWVVIDEVQRLPKLLDLVHLHIERDHIRFALTGSSARKLKRGAANLLAGRAFLFSLYPLTSIELGEHFNLDRYLSWGGLPYLHGTITDQDRVRYLRAYAHTYLQEEIIQEQIIRNLTPFRRFIEVAALSHGHIVNYSKIARDILSDPATVKSYFQILEDTLIGYLLPAYESSVRKRMRRSPKFFLLDPGIVRSLRGSTDVGIVPGSFEYGRLFEGFVIGEVQRRLSYREKDARLSYLLTKDGAEIDLVIERSGETLTLVEIKSSAVVTESESSALNRFARDLAPCNAFLLSRDPIRRTFDRVSALHWTEGVKEIVGD